MNRIITRKILKKKGPDEIIKIQTEGLGSSAASRVADMIKFNLEFKQGFHSDKRKPYKEHDFDLFGSFSVTYPGQEAAVK